MKAQTEKGMAYVWVQLRVQDRSHWQVSQVACVDPGPGQSFIACLERVKEKELYARGVPKIDF